MTISQGVISLVEAAVCTTGNERHGDGFESFFFDPDGSRQILSEKNRTP